MSHLTCPTCGRRHAIACAKVPPFCSERCQLIDLGRWFNEEIGLPYEGDPEDEAPPEGDGDPPPWTRQHHQGSPRSLGDAWLSD